MKDLILGMGEKLLNISVFIGIIIVVFTGLGTMFNQSFFYGFLIMLIGSIAIVISTYFIYLLIDIRDKSTKTNELLSKIVEKDKSL
ncbi:hypothetical protein [Aliarcobacter vitoriensis]|uniref:Uncharacterized protein n=1 Tax=Aliarcobacter vitoriensis TaxID=2011099 RepID=A0A366MTY5_9BACT|nr:hypothetical protein [Aliarcobacter vitoriensis]RBQ29527.1 hypothetical protein CRU91_04130 [Aliarcobacter vitoriensis]RBQ32353.1 hypothetical protein CRU92_01200 [Arcobacter sp. FW59]